MLRPSQDATTRHGLDAFAVAIASPAKPRTQVWAEYDTGTLGLQQALLRLPQTASVLHTGAHPSTLSAQLLSTLSAWDSRHLVFSIRSWPCSFLSRQS